MKTTFEVAFSRCMDYDPTRVEAAVRAAVDRIGGIAIFIRPGERVLIKPNLLTDASPEQGITTHPEVVRAVIRLVKTVTPNVICGDSPSVWGEKRDVERVYGVTGMRRVCDEEGVRLVLFNNPKLRGGYPLTGWIDEVDRVVNVPKFKTHGLTVLTAGVKNLYGFLVGMNKMKVHRDCPHPEALSRVVMDIYESRPPDLNICDGIVAMEGEGPGSSGTLRSLGLIAASRDALALDMALAQVMGLNPHDIPTNREGMRRGLRNASVLNIKIVGDPLTDFLGEPFVLPRTTFLHKTPTWVLDIARNFFSMKPVIGPACVVCGQCGRGCPAGAIEQQGDRMVIDLKKCILCLCCQEICPKGAVGIQKNFFLRVLQAIKR
jgi:uncharacterized protein (DUF362 family)/ferredoxin